jgi:putative sigma-54 modulation protein
VLFTITGKHIDITEAIRTHAEQKTEKLPRYYSSINRIQVIIEGNDGGKISVEIIASGEHNKIFVAKETGDDAYACIDLAVHKVERQLARKKSKERDNKHADVGEISEIAQEHIEE